MINLAKYVSSLQEYINETNVRRSAAVYEQRQIDSEVAQLQGQINARLNRRDELDIEVAMADASLQTREAIERQRAEQAAMAAIHAKQGKYEDGTASE